jgi:hypothetical protein
MPEQPPGAKRVPHLNRLRYVIEFEDANLKGEDAKLAEVATLTIALGAFQGAVEQYPNAKVLIRDRARIMRRYSPPVDIAEARKTHES